MKALGLESMLDQLLSIQVNTIVKQEIVATKMPNVAHALIDLAIDYGVTLNRLGAGPLEPPRSASWETFDAIRERASMRARMLQGLPSDRAKAQMAEAPPRELDDSAAAKVVLLCRIRDTADQLKAFFLDAEGRPRKDIVFTRDTANSYSDEDGTLGPQPPDARDRASPEAASQAQQNAPDERWRFQLNDRQQLVLRKAWELGTEEVVMQTIVYLDGDIISRIRLDYTRPERRTMLEAHQHSVNTAISFWKDLVDVVRSLIGLATRRR